MINRIKGVEFNQESIIQLMCRDEASQRTAAWVRRTREIALKGEQRGGKRITPYPSKTEVDRHGLGPTQLLSLYKFMDLLPGGGASWVVPYALEQQLRNYGPYLEGREVEIELLGHGSAVPRGWNKDGTLTPSFAYQNGSGPNLTGSLATELNVLHAETACAFGHTEDVARALTQNADKAKGILGSVRRELNLGSSGVNTFIALVGHPIPEAIPYAINSYEIHEKKPVFYQNMSEDVCLMADGYNIPGKGISPEDLDDYIRDLMDQGKFITGVGCLDIRQGINRLHESIEPIDLGKLLDQIQDQRGLWRRILASGNASQIGYGAVAHSEFPIGVFLTQGTNLVAACFLETHALAIYRPVEGGSLTEARGLILSIAEGTLDRRTSDGQTVRSVLYPQLEQLIGNLDASVFGRLGPDRDMAFVKLGDSVRQVTHERGLQLLLPQSPEGELLRANVMPALPIIGQLDAVKDNAANPKSTHFVPGTRRVIGPLIDQN